MTKPQGEGLALHIEERIALRALADLVRNMPLHEPERTLRDCGVATIERILNQ